MRRYRRKRYGRRRRSRRRRRKYFNRYANVIGYRM